MFAVVQARVLRRGRASDATNAASGVEAHCWDEPTTSATAPTYGRRIGQAHEVDEPGTIAPHLGNIRGDADRETALADPAGTDRRDEAMIGERPRQRGALGSPADERGHRHRQHTASRLLRCDLPRQRAPVGQLRLAQQCRHVRFDGTHRDEQLCCDLGVRQVPADERENLRLARRHARSQPDPRCPVCPP